MKKLLLLSLLLGGCATKPVIVEKPIEVRVEVPISCPSKEEYDRLMKLLPQALSATPMPVTDHERDALITAQLGRYEAPGQWRDQVIAALKRCQTP